MKLLNTKKMDTQTLLRFIEVRHGSNRTFLAPEKILHIDASSNYTTIHAVGHPPVMVAKVLKKYQQLLQGHGFLRINNSILINATRIHAIQQDGCVIMEDDSRFYPSRRRKVELKKLLLNYAQTA